MDLLFYKNSKQIKKQATVAALKIQTQLKTNHLSDLNYLLHKLKGSSGNIRANEISELLIKAEDANNTQNYEMLMELIENVIRVLGLYKNQ